MKALTTAHLASGWISQNTRNNRTADSSFGPAVNICWDSAWEFDSSQPGCREFELWECNTFRFDAYDLSVLLPPGEITNSAIQVKQENTSKYRFHIKSLQVSTPLRISCKRQSSAWLIASSFSTVVISSAADINSIFFLWLSCDTKERTVFSPPRYRVQFLYKSLQSVERQYYEGLYYSWPTS